MTAPLIIPLAVNRTSVNLPKRDELSFMPVFALPKASRRGLTYMSEDAHIAKTKSQKNGNFNYKCVQINI